MTEYTEVEWIGFGGGHFLMNSAIDPKVVISPLTFNL
jgi:hypothetical protein